MVPDAGHRPSHPQMQQSQRASSLASDPARREAVVCPVKEDRGEEALTRERDKTPRYIGGDCNYHDIAGAAVVAPRAGFRAEATRSGLSAMAADRLDVESVAQRCLE
jgi:hypothetical protein